MEKASSNMQCRYAEMVANFLRSIGLSVQVVPGAKGFVDKIALVDGAIHVDPECRASALLHEAGHLAIVPSQFRHLLSGNMYAGTKQMFQELEQMNLEPDNPLERAMMQIGDTEATSWAWAAGKSLGLPDKMIIQNDEYDGDGSILRMQLNARSYLGINGMAQAGFCNVRPNPYRPRPVYPELAFWLQA